MPVRHHDAADSNDAVAGDGGRVPPHGPSYVGPLGEDFASGGTDPTHAHRDPGFTAPRCYACNPSALTRPSLGRAPLRGRLRALHDPIEQLDGIEAHLEVIGENAPAVRTERSTGTQVVSAVFAGGQLLCLSVPRSDSRAHHQAASGRSSLQTGCRFRSTRMGASCKRASKLLPRRIASTRIPATARSS